MTTEKQGEIIEKIITPKKGRPSKVVQPVTIENVEVKEQARTIEFVTKPKSRNEALQYSVYVKGDVSNTTIIELINDSYEFVFASLTKKLQAEIKNEAK